MRVVEIDQDCPNILIFFDDTDFVVRNRFTKRYVVDRYTTTHSIEKAKHFTTWRDYDKAYQSFVVGHGNFWWLIYKDGSISRNYDEIGDISDDGSRPSNYFHDNKNHWKYLEGDTSKLSSTLSPGSQIKLAPRICGYNVSVSEDGERHWLWWISELIHPGQKAVYPSLKYHPMSHFENIPGSKEFFKGYKLGNSKDKNLSFRIFQAKRNHKKKIISPLLSPDYYIDAIFNPKENLFFVTLENGLKAVLFPKEKKLMYWPGTEDGKYIDFNICYGYLIAKRYDGETDILDKKGYCYSSLWKNVRIAGSEIYYENYFGDEMKTDFSRIRAERTAVISEFVKQLATTDKGKDEIEGTKIAEDKSKTTPDLSVDLNSSARSNQQNVIEYGIVSNSVEDYSETEIKYKGALNVICDSQRRIKVKKGDDVIFIWPNRNLLIHAFLKNIMSNYYIFECFEKVPVTFDNRKTSSDRKFRLLNLPFSSAQSDIRNILDLLCPLDSNSSGQKTETLLKEEQPVANNLETIPQNINDSNDLAITDEFDGIIDRIKETGCFLKRITSDEDKVIKALKIIFEDNLQRILLENPLNSIIEVTKKEPQFNPLTNNSLEEIIRSIVNGDTELKLNIGNKNDDNEIKERKGKIDFTIMFEGKSYAPGDMIFSNSFLASPRIYFDEQSQLIFFKGKHKDFKSLSEGLYCINTMPDKISMFLQSNKNFNMMTERIPVVMLKEKSGRLYEYHDISTYHSHIMNPKGSAMNVFLSSLFKKPYYFPSSQNS